MPTQETQRHSLRLSVAGDLWDAELRFLWPGEFHRRLLNLAGSDHVRLDVVGHICDSCAFGEPQDHYGGASDIETVRRTDGIFFTLARLRPWHIARLLDTFTAAGRDPRTVPLVIIIARGKPWPPTIEDTLRERFSAWPISAVVEVDCDTGAGIDRACARMLDLVAEARTQPAHEKPRSSPAPAPRLASHAPDAPLDERAVIAALDRADHEEALKLLLLAWRSARLPELAAAVEVLCYRARPCLPEQISHTWWLRTAAARRAVDLPLLLDTVMLPFEAELDRRAAQRIERLDALLAWPDDPRLTRRIGSFLADLGRHRHTSVWKALIRLLAHHGDPRADTVLRRLMEDLDEHVRPPNALRDPAIRAAAMEGLLALDARFAEGLPLAAGLAQDRHPGWPSLRARIVALAPSLRVAMSSDSEAERRAWAERLLAAGDPRGELTAVRHAATRRPLSEEELLRERSVARTYAWEWLGDLADVAELDTARFAGGFLTEITVRADNLRAVGDAVGRPEWATVEALDWGAGAPHGGEDVVDEALFTHPIMRALRRLSGVSLHGLSDLAGLVVPFQLDEVHLGASQIEPAVEDAIAAGASLPSVRRLSVWAPQPEVVSWAWQTPVLPGLTALEARGRSTWNVARSLREWWRMLDEAGATLEEVWLTRSPGVSLRLERARDEGSISRVSASQTAVVEDHQLLTDDVLVVFGWGVDALFPLTSFGLRAGVALDSWERLPDLVLESVHGGAAPSATMVSAMAASPDRRWVAFAESDGMITVDDAARMETVLRLDALAPAKVHALAFDAEGKHLLAFSHDDRIAVWSVPGFTLDRISPLLDAAPGTKGFRRAFSPDGRRCALFGYQEDTCMISVHDAEGRRLQLSPPLPRGFGHGDLAFSPDGSRLVVGGHDQSLPPKSEAQAVLLWELDRGSRPEELSRAAECVRAFGFSPDGARLYWLDEDGCFSLPARHAEGAARRLALWSYARWFDPAAYGLPPGCKLADVDAGNARCTPEDRARADKRDYSEGGDAIVLPNGTIALGSTTRWARWRLLPG